LYREGYQFCTGGRGGRRGESAPRSIGFGPSGMVPRVSPTRGAHASPAGGGIEETARTMEEMEVAVGLHPRRRAAASRRLPPQEGRGERERKGREGGREGGGGGGGWAAPPRTARSSRHRACPRRRARARGRARKREEGGEAGATATRTANNLDGAGRAADGSLSWARNRRGRRRRAEAGGGSEESGEDGTNEKSEEETVEAGIPGIYMPERCYCKEASSVR